MSHKWKRTCDKFIFPFQFFPFCSGSVYSCGQNTHHQLGHSVLRVKTLTPRPLSGKPFKSKAVKGVAVGRFHSALHTGDALYTFGLNAGQLGKRRSAAELSPRPPKFHVHLTHCWSAKRAVREELIKLSAVLLKTRFPTRF